MTTRLSIALLLLLALGVPAAAQTQASASDARPQLLIRCDDIGMCHSVNMAVEEVLKSGIPVSTSIMFACPWWKEGVEILKKYPHAAHGIHLTLNAEWKNYVWGPVAGWPRVPSLVDSTGNFFPSRAAFFAHHPAASDVERELRAQIERGIASGVRIDYVDYHMGTAVDTPELRSVVERLAKEYGLGISRYLGETDLDGAYAAPVASKTDTICAHLRTITPGTPRLMVFHIGEETEEMAALTDLNSFGLKDVGTNRHAELRGLLSPAFQQTVKDMHVQLLTYRDLIRTTGLQYIKHSTD